MAYVRITGQLKDRIRARINRMKTDAMRNFQIDELITGSPEHTAIAQIANRNVWGAHHDLKDKMPTKWCATVDSIEVRFDDNHGVERHRISVSLDDKHDKFPPNTQRWSLRTVIEPHQSNEVINNWLDGIIDAEAKAKECSEKFDIIRQQISNFMLKHTSLNTALKELPELEMYVPSEDMERVRRKVERSAPAGSHGNDEDVDDELGIDLDLLTSTAIADRMSKAR